MTEENFVGPIQIGQRWVEIRGNFTSNQLRTIADRIDDGFKIAFKDNKIIESNLSEMPGVDFTEKEKDENQNDKLPWE